MLPMEAKKHLLEMGCIEENQLGYFKIVKAPPARDKRDLDLFVSCIKCLGAWSTGQSPRVDVSCGCAPDEIQFMVR